MKDEADRETGVSTPRVCEACGGRTCRWCYHGFQDEEQQRAWLKFRERMRKISSTYSLLEKVVRELVDGLAAVGNDECLALAGEGRECLQAWLGATPDSPERREATVRMSLFQSEAVMALIKARTRSG